jgi:phosphosulfolactate synthase (CoM biosynthesis protein A)
MSTSPESTAGRAFDFLRVNQRPGKPRARGVTEIRGPYYTPMGRRYLQDILETMGAYVDALKFAGGSFCLMPRLVVKELIDLCHAHDVLVSTGGFIEYVMTQGPEAVQRYLGECRELGFDIVEISSGFITVPTDDLLRLVEQVQKLGMRAKPEVGIQFGAGGASSPAALQAEGTRDPEWAIAQARRFLGAGVDQVMIESEGITENVPSWRTDAVARLVDALGLAHLMFEAADPEVFAWYIKSYGPEVNLFVPSLGSLGYQEPLGPRPDLQGLMNACAMMSRVESDRPAGAEPEPGPGHMVPPLLSDRT